MKKQFLLFTVVVTSLVLGAWIVEAFGQTSTSTGVGDKIKSQQQKVQGPVTVQGIPAQFDLETRVEVLERQVAELRSQVRNLTAAVNNPGPSYVGPSGRLTPLNPGDEESGSEYSGPQIKLPKGKDDK